MTTAIKDWSTTAGDNNAPSPNGAPEGMAPSGVNDTIRQIMSEVREWYETAEWIDYGHSGLVYVDGTNFRITGDVSAIYTVGRRIRAIGSTPFTIYGTISVVAYSSPNTTVAVVWDSGSIDTNLDEVALGVAITNKPIHYNGIKLPTAGIPQSDIDGGVDFVGDYKISARTANHGKWLLCDESEISRTTYSDLFAILGTAFGVGDGSTTFNLPNPEGRIPMIAGQGTTAEGDETGTDRVLGATGGYETHTLITSEMPAHTHSEQHTVRNGSGSLGNLQVGADLANVTITTGSTGGDEAHNNMPPFITLGNLFIYSGVDIA